MENEVCRLLGMDAALCQQLPPLASSDYQMLCTLLEENRPLFLQEMAARPNPSAFALRFALRRAGDLRRIYVQRGYGDSLWRDTFSDLRIWNDHHLDRFHTPGLQQLPWLCFHLTLQLFRLGRLQFLPEVLTAPLDIPGRTIPAGTTVLTVHIAAGTPLSHQAVLDSYARAREFYHDPHPIFTCESWLLSPALPSLLPPGSNILQFQKDFLCYKTDPSIRQAEERIFGQIQDDPSGYPEHTHLQKAAKAWLCTGKTIPYGFGVQFG